MLKMSGVAAGLVLTLAATEASASKLIAVLPLDVRMTKGKISVEAQASLEELLRDVATDALAPAGWTILSGENTIQVLRDNGVSPEKCGDKSCHLEMARELKAEKFLSGAVEYDDGEFTASIRLFDTRTGSILASEHIEGKSTRELRAAFEAKANGLFTRAKLLEDAEGVNVPPANTTEEEPHKEGKGWLKVTSEPPGASVLIDGEEAGRTPLRKQMDPGEYAVSIEKDGFTPMTKTVTVSAAREELYFEHLLSAAGWIDVTVTPPTAQVSVDGKAANSGKQGPFAVGKHIVHAEASGYAAGDQAVVVENGGTSTAMLSLDPLPGKVLITVNVDAQCEAAGKTIDVTASRVGVLHVQPGNVHVTCRADGHADAAQDTSVEPGKSVSVRFTLQKDDRPHPGQVRTDAKSGLQFVYQPGGTFHLGCEPNDQLCNDDEKPGREATVAPMWMGRTEVTVAAYARCVTAGICGVPNSDRATCNWTRRDSHPVNCVTWEQANAFCQWMGGRLPTAEEWEFAAKGGESRVYPWGNEPLSGKRLNYCERNCPNVLDETQKKQWEDGKSIDYAEDDGYAATAPVGSYPAGASKWGVLDMAGNVWEWTASNYDADTKELRGGGWQGYPKYLRTSVKLHSATSGNTAELGFRCAM